MVGDGRRQQLTDTSRVLGLGVAVQLLWSLITEIWGPARQGRPATHSLCESQPNLSLACNRTELSKGRPRAVACGYISVLRTAWHRVGYTCCGRSPRIHAMVRDTQGSPCSKALETPLLRVRALSPAAGALHPRKALPPPRRRAPGRARGRLGREEGAERRQGWEEEESGQPGVRWSQTCRSLSPHPQPPAETRLLPVSGPSHGAFLGLVALVTHTGRRKTGEEGGRTEEA